MTEDEIKAPYITTHEELRKQYYIYGLISEAEHKQLHDQNWIDMEAELIAKGYRKPPEPVRDLATEIDKINEKLDLLLKKGK